MKDSNNVKSGGMSFASVLGIVFIVLKLTETIDWSWWWVLSPFWIGPAIVLVILILALLFSKNVKINKIFKIKKFNIL